MYIEREALLELKEEMWQDRCDHMVVRVTNIMNVPAADVAPVVHGKVEMLCTPERVEVDCMCKACCTRMRTDDNYCPNCGAKMGGGTKE